MSRYEIHARRQVPNAARDLASVAKMKDITIVTKGKTNIVAAMTAPIARQLAQKFSSSLSVSAVQ